MLKITAVSLGQRGATWEPGNFIIYILMQKCDQGVWLSASSMMSLVIS